MESFRALDTYDEFEDISNSIFVRALYDYDGTDPSALVFSKGAIIEVFTQLDTGWWDGVLNDERGWFPSNYVKTLTPEEVDVYLSGPDHSPDPYPAEDTSWLGVSRTSDSEPADDQFGSRKSIADDFWMPQVTADGQISYRNSKTGEESRDIPSTTSTVVDSPTLERSIHNGHLTTYDILTNPSKRQSALNPWSRRLADDGLSNYWYNTTTGEIRWTDPSVIRERTSGISGGAPYGIQEESALDPSSKPIGGVYAHAETAEHVLRRLSVYSDASSLSETVSSSHPASTEPVLREDDASTLDASASSQTTTAGANARELQERLAPDPPENLAALSTAAREALQDVTEAGSSGAPSVDLTESIHAALVMDKVSLVVLAVRNLLYISGTLASPLSSLMPQTVEAAESVRSPASDLKPFQRKVTATLSKLVLSARAAKSNASWSPNQSGARVDYDAAELDRAVLTFVTEVQRTSAYSRSKRLWGALESADGVGGVGLGNFGGGVGGHAKAFGFVFGDDASERQVLGRNLTAELDVFRSKVDESLQALERSVWSTEDTAVAQSKQVGALAVTELSSLLAFVEDIDIASYVDMTASRRGAESYVTSTGEARKILRELETAKQAIFDEGMLLLMVCQGIHISNPGPPNPPSKQSMQSVTLHLISSLQSHIQRIHLLIESLVPIAELQAESRRNGNGSVAKLRRRQVTSQNHSAQFSSHTLAAVKDCCAPLKATSASKEDIINMEGVCRRDSSFDDASSMLSVGAALSRPPAGHLGRPVQPASLSSGIISPTETLVSPKVTVGPRPPTPDSDDDVPPPPKNAKSPRTAKIRRLLGDDAPEAPEVNGVEELESPWYLRPTYGESDVILAPNGSVRGGKLSALVERLTLHDKRDTEFNDTFMMTFKSFTTVDELFNMLTARFEIEPPAGMNAEQHNDWTVRMQAPIRIRVINAFKSMLQEDDAIGPEDVKILDKMKQFAEKIETQYPPARLLFSIIDNKARDPFKFGVSGNARKMTPNIPQNAPPSIIPKASNRKMKLLDIDPLEIARQLTLKESELFCKIRAMECLARAKEEQGDNDSIRLIISMSNKIADWVNNAVLMKDDPRKRALIIKHFILTAERCRGLNNFSTMAALVAALNSPPIRRLKRTWDQVNGRLIAILDDVEKTFQSGKNLAEYRNMLANVSLPCVPFIGVYLTTLTFVQDGMKDNLVKEGNLINFSKRQKAAAIIAEIKRYQSQPYNLLVVEPVRAFLEESLMLENTSDYFWELSLQREPKERDDEKMARLLQESGFL